MSLVPIGQARFRVLHPETGNPVSITRLHIVGDGTVRVQFATRVVDKNRIGWTLENRVLSELLEVEQLG